MAGVEIDLSVRAERLQGTSRAANIYKTVLLRQALSPCGLHCASIVEVRSRNRRETRSDSDVLSGGARDRYWIAVLTHTFEMKIDCLANQFFSFIQRLGGHTETREIGSIRSPSRFGLFVDNEVFHLRPACLRILFNVPGSFTAACLAATTQRSPQQSCPHAKDSPAYCQIVASRQSRFGLPWLFVVPR